MNDKEIEDLGKDIDEYQKKHKDTDTSKPPELPQEFIDEYFNGLTPEQVNDLKSELGESLQRLGMPRDKLLKLEQEEERGLYGVTQEKMIKIMLGMVNRFRELMIENDLHKVPNYIPVKLLFVTTAFLLTDMVQNTRVNTTAQLNVMSSICSNITMLLKLTLDECHPAIKKAMKEIIPITLKTLISDDKLDKFSKTNDGAERSRIMLDEILKDVQEAQNKMFDKTLDSKKFWKDDIYKRD